MKFKQLFCHHSYRINFEAFVYDRDRIAVEDLNSTTYKCCHCGHVMRIDYRKPITPLQRASAILNHRLERFVTIVFRRPLLKAVEAINNWIKFKL